MSSEPPSLTIPELIEGLSAEFKLCRNRLWGITKALAADEREPFLSILSGVDKAKTGMPKPKGKGPMFDTDMDDWFAALGSDAPDRTDGHEECTFGFCEQSQLNFTHVQQRHMGCDQAKCKMRKFDTKELEQALEDGKPTAWALDGESVVERRRPYMACSHVWLDGTGTGAWAPGHVNSCLFEFWSYFAKKYQCEGIWWDTICIPMGKAARGKAIMNMQRNYEDARITLVHDAFIRSWEWFDPEVACLAIILSPWFSRGWTALELARSRKVKVIFSRGVVKDLDEDILAKPDSGASRGHIIASDVIRGMRKKGIADINSLMKILAPRHTSWTRDVAVISAQLARATVSAGSSQQGIYQQVIEKIGKIARENLFHNSVTMASGFASGWCPASPFEMPQSTTESVLTIGYGGDVTGEWDVFGVPDSVEYSARYVWKDTHPLIESKLRRALEKPEEHLLLASPDGDLITRALLVKIFVNVPKVKTPQSEKEDEVQSDEDQADEEPKGQEPGKESENPEKKSKNQDSEREESDEDESDEEEEEEEEEEEGGSDEDDIPEWLKEEEDTKERVLFVGPVYFHPAVERKALLGYHKGMKEMTINGLRPKREFASETVFAHEVWKMQSTDLHAVSAQGDYNLMSTMLQFKKDDAEKSDANRRNEDGNSPLHLAAKNGRLPAVMMLIGGADGDANLRNNQQQTPLHLAVENGQDSAVSIMMQLVEKKLLDLNLQDVDGWTALHSAAWNCFDAIAAKLIENGADVNLEEKSGQRALHLACERGNIDIVTRILGAGGEVLSQSNDEQTALHRVAWGGSLAVAKLLIERSAPNSSKLVGILDKDKRSALHAAAEKGYTSIVELLLENGALLDARDSRGQTALHLAALEGHDNALKVLLDRGADVTIEDENGRNALSLAPRWERVIKVLLEHGADLDTKEARRALLQWAVSEDLDDIQDLILERGEFQINLFNPGPHREYPLGSHEWLMQLTLNNFRGTKLVRDKGDDDCITLFPKSDDTSEPSGDEGRSTGRRPISISIRGGFQHALDGGSDAARYLRMVEEREGRLDLRTYLKAHKMSMKAGFEGGGIVSLAIADKTVNAAQVASEKTITAVQSAFKGSKAAGGKIFKKFRGFSSSSAKEEKS